MPVSISIELTPNPDVENFVVAETLVQKGPYEFQRQSALEKAPLAQKLFQIKTVEKVKIFENCVQITRQKNADWLELEEQISQVLEKQLLQQEKAVQELPSLQIVVPVEKNEAFFEIEITPNPLTKKFMVPSRISDSSQEFSTREEAEKVPLAKALFSIEGVANLLIAPHYVSVSKANESINWSQVEQNVSDVLQKYFQTGSSPQEEQIGNHLPENMDLQTVEGRIQFTLQKHIRPLIAMDGGDVTFLGFQDGVVSLKLRGACKGCPSSTLTLKQGIETRLKAAVPEVKAVVQEI